MLGGKPWKRRVILGIAVLFAVDLLFFFAGVRPFRAVERRRLSLRDELRREHQEKARQIERLRNITAKLSVAREQADSFLHTRLLSQKTGYSAVIDELDAITATAAVRKGTVTFKGKPLEGLDLQEVGINTTVEGDYPSLARFVNRLEQSRRFFIIENLSLASAPNSPIIKLNLRLATYFTS